MRLKFAFFLIVVLTSCQTIQNENIGKGPIELDPVVLDGLEKWRSNGAGAWAFAVAIDGSNYGYTYCKGGIACGGRPSAEHQAITYCERNSGNKPCRIYGKNGKVVWDFDSKAENLTGKDRHFKNTTDSFETQFGEPIPKEFLSQNELVLSNTQYQGYAKYLSDLERPNIRTGAFAVSVQPKYRYGWQTWKGADNHLAAAQQAMKFCQKSGAKCYIYAVGDYVLKPSDATSDFSPGVRNKKRNTENTNTTIERADTGKTTDAENEDAKLNTAEIKHKLRELQSLYEGGLIDEQEYKATRKRILESSF